MISCKKYVELDLHKMKRLYSVELLPSDKFVREVLYLPIWSVTRDQDTVDWNQVFFHFSFKLAFQFEKNESSTLDGVILGSSKFIKKFKMSDLKAEKRNWAFADLMGPDGQFDYAKRVRLLTWQSNLVW